MGAQSPMQLLGNVGGLPVYFADQHFDTPGIYTWDGKENILLIPLDKK